jgi:hypothetical protein
VTSSWRALTRRDGQFSGCFQRRLAGRRGHLPRPPYLGAGDRGRAVRAPNLRTAIPRPAPTFGRSRGLHALLARVFLQAGPLNVADDACAGRPCSWHCWRSNTPRAPPSRRPSSAPAPSRWWAAHWPSPRTPWGSFARATMRYGSRKASLAPQLSHGPSGPRLSLRPRAPARPGTAEGLDGEGMRLGRFCGWEGTAREGGGGPWVRRRGTATRCGCSGRT